jgi:hypothetical protein
LNEPGKLENVSISKGYQPADVMPLNRYMLYQVSPAKRVLRHRPRRIQRRDQTTVGKRDNQEIPSISIFNEK